MALKVNAKFKGKLTRGLKINLKSLVNFYFSSRKSGNLHFDGLLLSKAYKGLDEKVQKSYISWHWRVMPRFEEKLTLGSKNDTMNFMSFNESRDKSKNLHLDVLLLSIVYKKIQTFKKNWLLVPKWHEEFYEF